ncbi:MULTISPECIES: XrtA/PEP-CTERM system histidine kinase PrsK [Rhodanobacter]|uniref:XrtA/PEP-CTERM system histidine kinase PrsK n=1 Tax=Rhodanobacter TaxID=75309 RepID=UPI0004183300|nr:MULTISPECIES: XrtA/PEP-CTERM system histidine kinase PrsK [Rhodanobacter]TAN16802.1 MAG: PEP-CTERM system histidine kinase PrsK [Rhodanobacter sp.]UJJ54304.1 PEP-CTERM system histidine kinase PrsK [Rhodanobacter thiooxydans]
MHVIIITSYLTAAAAFLAGAALLGIGWRGQRTGALLILAAMASALWGAFLAYAEWQRTVAANWMLLAEVLRYGAWIVFVSALFSAWPISGLLRDLRVVAHALWIVLALYCLWPVTGLPQATGLPFSANVPLVGVLVLALSGVMLLEQIYRNVQPQQRWALKFLVIALGLLFAYDIFLYSYAVLYRQFNVSAWAARGFIDALLVPLLLVAAARNPQWSLDVGVSRRAVFYSTSLLVVAIYIIGTAIGGYYVRLYGGDWGRVAEITLVCFALLLVLLIAFSGQARSRLRVFLHKNFFSFRHDYREEWLRLTATLSAGDTELPQRAVHAIAQIMDSPAGTLFMRDDADDFVPEARWNMPTPAGLKLPASLPAFGLMRTRRWIYDLDEPPPLGDEQLRAPAELTGLPRAWLLVPLVLEDRLVGFVVLARARARRAFDWEDIDLLRAAGSQVAGILAQAADARRLAEARQFEGFNRLTAFLMHDLKNLAAQQSLLLQNAERHKHNPAFVGDMLATVANSVQRISRLLEQLRGDVAPARHGRVALATVLDKALDECRAQSPRPEYRPVTDDLWVQTDTEQLATVLGHVIRNAQDAAQSHGHVLLRVRHEPGLATIEIEDDGAGMDEDFIRNRLFKPFFTTKASKGMGIGAYQARAYVHSLGGTMRVNSTPGQGSVFTIQLPLAEPAGAAMAAGQAQTAP